MLKAKKKKKKRFTKPIRHIDRVSEGMYRSLNKQRNWMVSWVKIFQTVILFQKRKFYE